MQAAPATAATNAYGIALPIPTRLFKFRAAPVAPGAASVRTNFQDPLQEYTIKFMHNVAMICLAGQEASLGTLQS